MSDMILMSKPHFNFGNTPDMMPQGLPYQQKDSLETRSEGIDPLDYSRALAKITSLERSIDRLNQSHSVVLKDLHQEMTNLQNTISGNGSKSAALESPAQQPMCPGDPKDSIYLLLQEQKNKYRTVVDRLSHENKKKSYTIDLLKSQLELIQKALSLAGLELDMAELQSLVSKKVKPKADQENDEENHAQNEPALILNQSKEMKPVKEAVPTLELMTAHPPTNQPSPIKKASNLEETQSQITKSYIEHVLKLKRDSTLPNQENQVKKSINNFKFGNQEQTQESAPIVVPCKPIFMTKEPLPPILIDDKMVKTLSKNGATNDASKNKTVSVSELNPNFDDLETASLNRWTNDTDMTNMTDKNSILYWMNKQKSSITEQIERKQKLREKKFKG